MFENNLRISLQYLFIELNGICGNSEVIRLQKCNLIVIIRILRSNQDLN